MGFVVEPRRFVEGDEQSRAAESLRKYYAGFVGRHSDQLLEGLDPNRFDERDFFAVSMLSVRVPPEAGLRLIGNVECEALLGQIPLGASISDLSVPMDKQSPAWRLWDLLRSNSGLGPTITSKLMAAKRPGLIPVHDTFVSNALMRGQLDGEWAAWREAMSSPDLAAACDRLRETAGVPDGVTDLRMLDVVIWMRVHGDKRDGDSEFWLWTRDSAAEADSHSG